MFRWLRWYWAKTLLGSPDVRLHKGHVRFLCQQRAARPEDFPPNAASYERLANVWDDFAGWYVSGYVRFLRSAERHYGQPIRTVLDLACGSGHLSRQLARRSASVVGLDLSDAMLRQAGCRTKADNVRYIRGDSRDFRLDETFHAVTCAGDSLNYVETPGEVADVCLCVRRHLEPGGLFVFDVLDDTACRASACVSRRCGAGSVGVL